MSFFFILSLNFKNIILSLNELLKETNDPKKIKHNKNNGYLIVFKARLGKTATIDS